VPTEGRVVALYEDEDVEPLTEAQHTQVLKKVLDWFEAADRKREDHRKDWRRQYAMYRSWTSPRAEGDWRSRVYIPMSFHVIETVMPKLIAQLPTPIVLPVGPEDEQPASKMEERLKWAFDQARLYLQLVSAYRSALKYGTGLLKVYPGKRVGWTIMDVPVMETVQQPAGPPTPTVDPLTGEPLLGMDGQPMIDEPELIEVEQQAADEQGQPKWEQVRREFTYYQGPIAEAIDIEDFWPAPEASSVEDARYAIHRVWRDLSYVKGKVADGTYVLPEGMSLDSLAGEREDSPALERQGDIGLSSEPDVTRDPIEVWEVWTDEEVLTVLNRRIVVRVAPMPFAHGQKPFARVLDHFQEHEFWGIGELGPILGIQDAINALWNSRIDNVRLVMQRVFAVNPENLYDLRDLRLRPGGTIRMKSTLGINPSELIYPIDIEDVTSSAYEEVQVLIDLIERVLAVSAYQTGVDSPDLNDTATGVALITEQGNSRFALKVRMGELTGLVPLSRMFGSLLQQFGEPEMMIRREGAGEIDPATGVPSAFEWEPASAAEIQGAFDFDIEAGSATQNESVRQQTAMTLFEMLQGRTDAMGFPLANDRELLKDLLRELGKKDIDRLMAAPPALPGLLGGGMPAIPGLSMGAPAPSVEQAVSGGVAA
jgi:hypothetical protein